jgi:GntR family transcriptional regulator
MVESDKAVGRGRPRRSSDIPLAGSRALDRRSVVPLYFQLGAVLKEKVDTGAWQAGDRFPTEREIEEEFGVSRTVIRRALDLLVGDGGIVRIKGSGAFVAPPRRDVPLFGLVRACLEPPDDLAITVLAMREQLPDSAVSHFLEMDGQPTPISHVTAVMHVDKQPACLVESYSSANLVPWLLPTVQALQAGSRPPDPGKLNLSRARVSIELTFFGRWGGPRVGASAGDPALMARLIQFGRGAEGERERPLEFAYLVCRSDNAQLAIELD